MADKAMLIGIAEGGLVGNDDRPNVLVIMTDQQSANAMSCAGNAELRTPAIDSLADAGVRFGRAYCTSPLCTPSRASMLTGRMPSALGVNDNVRSVPDGFPEQGLLGTVFAEAGYDCAYAGKWHIPGVPYGGFDNIHAGGDEGLADACNAFLAADDRQSRPFLMVASFNEPHGICEWARGQAPPSGEVEDPDWRDLPLLPPNFASGSEEAEAPRLVQNFAWAVHPTQAWDEQHWRRYRYAYFRLCERIDAEIGSLLAGLEMTGLRERTVVVFTSDHGDMQGAHRWNQKKNLYEESAGVPFIVSPPGGATRGTTIRGTTLAHVRDELVSVGVDLLPTLSDYAGIKPDPEWAGLSVRPLVEAERDARPAWRDQVITETMWTFPGLMPPPVMSHLLARMVRTPQYKYVCHSWGRNREQLFDLLSDPGELTNLATSGAHQGVLDEHRRRLLDHCVTSDEAFARYVPAAGTTPR